MFWKHLCSATLLLILASPLHAAGDPTAGQAKAESCAACHGHSGISSSPNIPHLAGQFADFIVLQMKSFREQSRKDDVMYSVATLITDQQDLADIAAYYAGRPRHQNPEPKESTFELGKQRYHDSYRCFECHGNEGEGKYAPAVSAPLLAGQNKQYLIKVLKDFKQGKWRSETGYMMNLIMPRVPDEEIEAMAEYLSKL